MTVSTHFDGIAYIVEIVMVKHRPGIDLMKDWQPFIRHRRKLAILYLDCFVNSLLINLTLIILRKHCDDHVQTKGIHATETGGVNQLLLYSSLSVNEY